MFLQRGVVLLSGTQEKSKKNWVQDPQSSPKLKNVGQNNVKTMYVALRRVVVVVLQPF
jgi:hypothetical protein